MITLIVVLVIIGVMYCLSLMANHSRKERMQPYREVYIAHRGLFDNTGDAPENSYKAFEKAVQQGYGIELDVQMTTDGRLVVFHDENLNRMCNDNKKLYTLGYEELKNYTLKDSGEHIPLFEDVLELIDGKVPLVVEIKSEGNWKETTKRTARMLDDYNGLYCVESFNPGVLLWYRRNRPEVIRGQLSMDYFKHNSEYNPVINFLMTNLMCNIVSYPDFIAYDHRQKNQLSYRICRKIYNPENVAWTIKSHEELEEAGKVFGCFIFDGFIPKEK